VPKTPKRPERPWRATAKRPTRQPRATAKQRVDLATKQMAGLSAESLRKVMFASPIPQIELWRSYYGGAVDMGRIEIALNGAYVGNMRPLTDLSREMVDRDPHLASVLLRRLGLLSMLDYDVVPATGEGIDPVRAQLYASVVRDQLGRIRGFRTKLFQLAWGIYDGRAALEKLWADQRSGPIRWTIKGLGWIHPRRISFGPEREFRIVDAQYNASYFQPVGEALRDYPFKFLEFRPHLFGEYPEREGLGPRCLYWCFFKRFGWRERLILMELFGKPWRIIEIDKDASVNPEDLKDADAQIQALGGAQSARLPRGAKLNAMSPGDNAGRLHESTPRDVDLQISKLVLGQTMTTEAQAGQGIGSKQAEVQDEQQTIVHKMDASTFNEVIEDQLTDDIIVLNFGVEALSHAPRFMLRVDPKSDPDKEVDRLGKALQTGLPISLAEAYERTGYKPPQEDEPALQLTTAPTSEGGAPSPIARATIVWPPGTAPEPREVQIAPGAGGPPVPDNAPGVDEETGEIGTTEDDAISAQHQHTPSLLSRQPDTVNGSPETLVDRAVRETARETARWTDKIAAALEGYSDAGSILRQLKRLSDELNVQPFARVAERRMMHGLMLGALDSAWERENEQAVAPVAFAAPQLPGEGVPAVPAASPSFAGKPYSAALQWFRGKQVLSRASFEQLSVRAKRRAFTVAGMARDDMLEAVHAELLRQVQDGADLRTFRQFAKDRLESAGWTPANPSHVETIYRTNVMGAYSAGRHAEMTQPAVLAARPYWQFVGVDDARTRPTHRAVHRKVFRASDPLFQKIYPPMGYCCRDRVRSLSQADVDRLGLQISTAADVRDLPDPGFDSGVVALL
jgi:SPP1 gp7 family putative phage head morphogenesis protein